jgi:hydroxymethylpyrimidine pyrophosphatase-like HAD family hydrolase
MPATFQAVALDYDGTLTRTPRPEADVLESIAAARTAGRAIILVTGRILAELRVDFPDVERHFDAIVAENGAVLSRQGMVRDLAGPVDPRLGLALAHQEVPLRHGRVLLACDAVHDEVVLREVTRLGLECQLIHNRAALMVLPAGVTKGTGLRECLGELGIPFHSVIGVGDAENDHSLLEASEVGVAVADAVPGLLERADLVLDRPDGEGIRALLSGPVLAGEERIRPARWRVPIGTDEAGDPVRVPANQVDLLLAGASGSGKSYLAGLVVEGLVGLGYSCLVLDVAGEHRELDRLRGVLTVGGGGEPLPPPERVSALLSHRFGSLVLDLSQLPAPARWGYVAEMADVVAAHRRTTGLPHWLVMEEAHAFAGSGGYAGPLLGPGGPNRCLVTYHPLEVCPSVRAQTDLLVAARGEGPGAEQTAAALAEHTGRSGEDVRRALLGLPDGMVLLGGRGPEGTLSAVSPAGRRTAHVRHQRKYGEGELPPHLRFYFSAGDGPAPVAGNIGQFHDILGSCAEPLVDFHLRRADFSRWLRDVLSDVALAEDVAAVERDYAADGDLPAARGRILAEVASRYL